MSEHIVPISISPLFLAWYFSPLISLFFLLKYYFCHFFELVSLCGKHLVSYVWKCLDLTFNLLLKPFFLQYWLIYSFTILFLFSWPWTYGMLVLWLGIEPKSTALKMLSLNHWARGKEGKCLPLFYYEGNNTHTPIWVWQKPCLLLGH